MISIVIPALNEEKYIASLLQSIAKQKVNEDIEIVVADAGSTDHTKEVAMEYSQTFKSVKVVPGGMPAVGRNNGAKASLGDPIFFIDADMVLLQTDFLKKSLDYFRGHNLAIATSFLKPNSQKLIDHVLVGLYNVILRGVKYIRPLGAMCIVASREAFQKSGGYPENVVMAEDHDFVKNCLKFGKYGILPTTAVFSVRRFNKEGRLGLAGKYLKASAHRVFYGPITKPIFDYEFKYSEKEDSLHSPDA